MTDAPTPTLGLALIARDEERTLPRLLASCANAFDEVVLVDTGSTDATIERFEDWASSQPATRCRVERFLWCDDFAAARQYASELLGTDWWCWADCDDEIVGAVHLRRLAAEAAAVVAALACAYAYDPGGRGLFHFQRERLIRAGRGRWVGRIHEVIELDGELVDIDDELVVWIHHGDGGGRARGAEHPRLRADLRLLETEVREDPYNRRAIFYLAQTHRDLGNPERAIEHYSRRAEMGGWDEEVFYSRYQIGVLRAGLGDWDAAMAQLLDAWELRPSRAEPLHELAWRLRVRGQYRAAHLFAVRGIEIPEPADRLFVHPWVYRYGMLFEYSIAAYWADDLDGGLAACQRLLALDDLPEEHRTHTLANRAFFRERLKRVSRRNR
jgi:glycosyltransferase involved in cell wall biosynthesis